MEPLVRAKCGGAPTGIGL
uniref:Uncharacterized protein n=1 Tax=Anguilla anguilla TaxID=7936 RepID=A0A0E9R8H4_ANGAN